MLIECHKNTLHINSAKSAIIAGLLISLPNQL